MTIKPYLFFFGVAAITVGILLSLRPYNPGSLRTVHEFTIHCHIHSEVFIYSYGGGLAELPWCLHNTGLSITLYAIIGAGIFLIYRSRKSVHRKALLSFFALGIIPLAIAAPYLVDADKIGKEFAINNPGETIDISWQEQLLHRQPTHLIEGTVMTSKPFWKVYPEESIPRIFTEFRVRVDDTIYGHIPNVVIKVVMAGGTIDGIITETEAVDMVLGTQVIMLLDKDTHNLFYDRYYPVSSTESVYIVQGDQATNKLDGTSHKDKIKAKLSDEFSCICPHNFD